MDNTPIRKVSDIEYAFTIAAAKKATCVHLYINIDHLVFKHEFIPTNLSARRTDIAIDDHTPATPSPSDPTNALTPEFQKVIVDLASGTHMHMACSAPRRDSNYVSISKIIPMKNTHRAPLFVVALCIYFEFLLYGMLIACKFLRTTLFFHTSYKMLVKVNFLLQMH